VFLRRRHLALALVLLSSSCGRIGYDEIVGALEVGGASGSEGSGGSRDGGAGDSASGGFGGANGSGGAGAGTDAASGGVTGGTAGSDGAVNTGGTAPIIDAGSRTIVVDLLDPAQTVRSGAAQLGNGELDLTYANRDVAGAAYLPSSFAITPTTSFTASFSFRIYGAVGQSGDGFAFLWQNDPRGTGALSGLGDELGYAGVSPSVVVEFDIWQNAYDPGPNDVAITTNGQNTTALAHQFAPFNLNDGATHYAWVDYQSASQTVSVYLSNTATRPSAALVSAPVSLYTTVGSSAFIGFTAACGGANDYFALQSLTIVESTQ
jgi:hypothetical protein